MSWWSTLPVALITVSILFVPGAVIAWSARARGFAIIAMAPAISLSMVSVGAVLATSLGVAWSIYMLAALSGAVSVIAFGCTRLFSSAERPPRKPWVWKQISAEVAAIAIAAFLIGRRMVYIFGNPEAISQTFDNVFHLNAVRYILETGNGSSFTVGEMTGGAFYPAAWHNLVALVVGILDSPIPVGSNIVNLVVAALIWPIACIFLVQQVVGRRPLPTVVAGVLAAGFGSFPILMMDFGVLYPNALGISLLPVGIAAVLGVCGLGKSPSGSGISSWMLLLTVLPGMTLAHPSSTMALLGACLPILLGVWWRNLKKAMAHPARRGLLVATNIMGLVLGTVILHALWNAIRPDEAAATWEPIQTTGRAFGELLTVSQIGRPVSTVMTVLIILGLIALVVRRENLWLVGTYSFLGMLFIAGSSFKFGELRTFLTGIWYNDSPRLAAMLPVVLLPIAVVGVMFAVDWVLARTTLMINGSQKLEAFVNPHAGLRRFGAASAIVLLIVALAFSTQKANVRASTDSAAAGYRMTADSALLSPDEKDLIMRLEQHVPESAVIAANPWTGTALAYALANRRTLQLALISEISPEQADIFRELRKAKTSPEVCPVVQELGVQFVLDFGEREVHGGSHDYRGLEDLVENGVASVVDQQGEAKLLGINVCQ